MTRGSGRGQYNIRSAGSDRRICLDGDRAQTTIDFMIGAGVFMITVGFVLGVIPGMIDPFSESQETTLVADRLATQISEGMLAKPDQPTVLNQTCVNAFFDQDLDPGSGADCPVPFDETVTDLPDRLGVREYYSINVTLERDIDSDGQLEILSTDGNDISGTGPSRLAIGDSPPDRQSVVVASRTAFVDGMDVRVMIRVW